MACSLTYREGPKTIVIKGFPTVLAACKHARNKSLNSYLLKVAPED